MRIQKSISLFTLTSTLLLASCFGQSLVTHSAPRNAEAIDSEHGEAIGAARRLLHNQMDLFPGLSVAVGIDGRIVWAEGFGWADLEQRVPVRPWSRFRVGSVAKPMTAALLALVFEEGQIDLDAPVQRYVPNFPVKKYPITTRQLGGHLAGIRHYRGAEFLSAKHYATVVEGLEIFKQDALLFEPGTDYSYSSYGWNLISAVIEGASGQGFLKQMEERVFGALGMRSTEADQNRLIVPDRVRPYLLNSDGHFENAPYVDNSYKWAGGGFVSTAEDLVRFGSAHLEPGFLKAETLELLHTSQKTADGKETGYGIGWRMGQDDQDRHVVRHGGGSVGGRTALMLWPEEGVVVAMIVNLSNGAPLPAADIAELFRKRN